jgi:hypothetical protein
VGVGCPHTQQWLHVSRYASLYRDLTAVATITDQLARASIQGESMLVERSPNRLPIGLPCRPHLHGGDHIRLAAGDQEVRLVPEHSRLARPHYLLCIRVGRTETEIVAGGAPRESVRFPPNSGRRFPPLALLCKSVYEKFFRHIVR